MVRNIGSPSGDNFDYKGDVMKTKTCCFTGHRKIPPAQYKNIAKRLRTTLSPHSSFIIPSKGVWGEAP